MAVGFHGGSSFFGFAGAPPVALELKVFDDLCGVLDLDGMLCCDLEGIFD